jgi:hypothetical protein
MNVSYKLLRSLTYSLDIQTVGVCFWCGNFAIQFGGTEVDDEPFYYPFVFVLPNYFSWHTPFDKFRRVE